MQTCISRYYFAFNTNMINDKNIAEMKEKILRILKENMYVATGCTEPAAVSYCASVASNELKKLGDDVFAIDVVASKNILKNAMSAGLPNTTKVGVNFAAGIGATHGDPKNVLNVNNDVKEEDYDIVDQMTKNGNIKVSIAKEPNLLYIKVTIKGKSHETSCTIADSHTNVVEITVDGKVTFEGKSNSNAKSDRISPKEIAELLSIEDIVTFCDKYLDVEKDDIEILKKAEELNMAISEKGLESNYGLNIGKNIKNMLESGNMHNANRTRALMRTTAAADARMAGAPYPVVANSGSGNQGITLSVPVISYANDKNVSKEKKYKALAISNLVSIYIKSKFGTLSAFCGAMVASIGAGCGIAYLYGGNYNDIAAVIHNMAGSLTGMICDGAKPDCALKIYSGLETAIFSARLALDGERVSKDDGIVCEDVERTIDNVAEVSVECSSKVDDIVLGMMINK